jgi:hypothetical protein
VTIINLRHGTATSAAALSVDGRPRNGISFSDVAVVPEPASLFLFGGLGLLGVRFIRRRS